MKTVPMIALRGITVLPGMLIHFDVTRKSTKIAATEAFNSDGQLFVTFQKDSSLEQPDIDDIYTLGVMAEVKQIAKLTKETDRVMVAIKERSRLYHVVQTRPFFIVDVEKEMDENDEEEDLITQDAQMRALKELYQLYLIENPRSSGLTLSKIKKEKNYSKLPDLVAGGISLSEEQKLDVLNCIHIQKRYDMVCSLVANEINILRTKKDIQERVKAAVDKNQKDYVMREQIRILKEELGETASAESEKYKQRLLKLNANDEVKNVISDEIKRFESISVNSSESVVSRGYIETLLNIPWEEMSEDNKDLSCAEQVLNRDHYGLKKVKERILEFLAVRTLTGKGEAPIICLVGPPGTGKTSIAKSIASALNKQYVRICLGGIRDEAEIRGHRRTYVGALPGQLIHGLVKAKVKNSLILLDEIDKVGSDVKGDPASALLEVLDPEQNAHFTDHYVEIPVDLSEVLFLCTANSIETIPRPLYDRMEIIEVSGYTENEKLHIAKEHLFPKQLSKNGLTKKELSINDKAINDIILYYTREAGVRSLERTIGKVCRKAAKEIVMNQSPKVSVSGKNLNEFLGMKKYRKDKINRTDDVGIVCGLAWTQVGGEILEIEVNVMSGDGGLVLTGQLGDVMKESAKIALSYVRSLEHIHGKDAEYFATHDFHLHVPEGAVPKDGPSAGITMATAILSAITEHPIRRDVAMTGELTLRGRVLPIGGLKEKLLAAQMAGVKLCLVPKDNEMDVSELDLEIVEGIDIKYVSHMNEVTHLLCF